MNLFIDTNVFLAFYHFSSDDLEELRKLVALLKRNEIQLHVPQQVQDEFRRNREVKIADAMKRLREAKFRISFPQFAKAYAPYQALRVLLQKADKAHSELIETLTQDALATELQADEVIESLFKLAKTVEVTDKILMSARRRSDRGNPPGKRDSLGDAINWESLLSTVPAKEQLVFVSDDGDYASALDDGMFNQYLSAEWREAKDGEVIFFRSLSPFFKKHYPEITLASEVEKDLLIRDLANSGSFARTHSLVARLSNYSEFTDSQAVAIANATLSNNQVRLISGDPDVRRFLRYVLSDRRIDSQLLDKFSRVLSDSDNDEDDD